MEIIGCSSKDCRIVKKSEDTMYSGKECKCLITLSFDDRIIVESKLDKLDEIERMLEKIDQDTSSQDDYLVIESMKGLFGQLFGIEE